MRCEEVYQRNFRRSRGRNKRCRVASGFRQGASLNVKVRDLYNLPLHKGARSIFVKADAIKSLNRLQLRAKLPCLGSITSFPWIFVFNSRLTRYQVTHASSTGECPNPRNRMLSSQTLLLGPPWDPFTQHW